DGLQLQLGLIHVGKLLQARRLGEQAPVGLEQIDRLLLELDLALDPVDLGELVLDLALGVVGEGRGRNHDRNQHDVAGTKHECYLSPDKDASGNSGRSNRSRLCARGGSAVRTATLSLADRARGLAAISASVGAIGPLTFWKVGAGAFASGKWRETE